MARVWIYNSFTHCRSSSGSSRSGQWKLENPPHTNTEPSGQNPTDGCRVNPHPPSPVGWVALTRSAQGCPGKIFVQEELVSGSRQRFSLVLRGLDPRIHVFVSTVSRRGCPRIK